VSTGRRDRIWGLIVGKAADRGGPVSAGDACVAAAVATGATGAWLTAARDADAGHLMRVTGKLSEQLAELQLMLGEGPSLDAVTSGGPVLTSDLDAAETRRRWPAFAPAAGRAGAAAVFAFPLLIGAIRAGVLTLYRNQPGPLNLFQLGDALVFADTATALLLDAQDHAAGNGAAGNGAAGNGGPAAAPGGQPADLARHRAEIDQATGMLTEQLGVGIADAFIRLRAYAYARDLRLTDVARDIIARHLRLSSDPGPGQDGDA
jgi:hypothetical protein